MLWLKLPVADRFQPQSDKFATGVENEAWFPQLECEVPEISIPIPCKGLFLRPPSHALWKFQLSFIHFFNFFLVLGAPYPRRNSKKKHLQPHTRHKNIVLNGLPASRGMLVAIKITF